MNWLQSASVAAGLGCAAVAYQSLRKAASGVGRYEQLVPSTPKLHTFSEQTALVVIDPYHDFFSADGAVWPLVRCTDHHHHFTRNVTRVLHEFRESSLPVAFAPHHRFHDGSFQGRRYLSPSQQQQKRSRVFARDGIGGQWASGLAPHDGEIVSSEHASSSGFAETDLHVQLQQRGITHVVLVGCISNSCVEATARSAHDLGYHVTVVVDAIGAFTLQEHELACRVSLPLVVHCLATTEEVTQAASMHHAS